MKKRGNSELALASGVIGRYVYVQLLGQQSELENIAERMLKLINDSFQRRNLTVTSEEKASYFKRALAIAGVPDDIENINPFTALFFFDHWRFSSDL
ncbi:MAG: hypothetical protein A2Z20_03945 [Bdellovibrionales bacterium RBG_16_40_8]|nr:MAG: hypothetical protein A2Z20_03945 [Bdellovibrionales bacterium RBG_16_40_8]